MVNITAITWLMSFNSLPVIRRYPNPRLTKSSSPAISDRHANDHPCFSPGMIDGNVAGRITSQNKVIFFAPIFFPALIYKEGTFLILESVAVVMELSLIHI